MEEASIRGFKKRMAVDESLSCCKRTKLCFDGCTCSYLKECCGECDGCDHCCLCLRECCTPVMIGKAQFWIFSALGLTWPYRWLFKCLTDKTGYTVKKKFYMSKPWGMKNYKVRKYGDIIKEANVGMEPEPDEAEEAGGDDENKDPTQRDSRV